MDLYFITGTSAGVGKALAEKLLKKNKNFVVGFARRPSEIKLSNYLHYKKDFSKLEENFSFEIPDILKDEKLQKLVLINNAATIGQIKQVGKKEDNTFEREYITNIIWPHKLINLFIKAYKNLEVEKIILNISSGAGRSTLMPSWGTYCASKAALDIFSLVVENEQKEILNELKRFKIYSVAPGIIDTQMQKEIRKAKDVDFSNRAIFDNYKKNNQLSSPKDTAQKLISIIEKKPQKVILDIRDM